MRRSQCDIILSHLLTPAALTTSQALSVYGIGRLASRIDELRQEGWPIVTTMFPVGNGKRYAAYSLLSPARQRFYQGGR